MSQRCDFIISAFGSTLASDDVKLALKGLEFDSWGSSPKIDTMTMATSLPDVFCGGDVAGTAETAVEAAADGKIAAWSMHRHLQVIIMLYKKCNYIKFLFTN